MSRKSSEKNNKKAIVEKLKEYRARYHASRSFSDVPRPVKQLVTTNPFACLVGCAFNSRQKSERAWDIPYQIEKSGMLDPHKLASMSHQDLMHLIDSLPRLPISGAKKGAQTLRDVASLVVSLGGDPLKSWKDATVFDVELHLDNAIYGVGEAVSKFTVRMLHDYFGIFIGQEREIDVKADIHVKRVFKRVGFIPFEDEASAVSAAYSLNPDYPGELCWPAFDIGKRWCRRLYANCSECFLTTVCPKRVD